MIETQGAASVNVRRRRRPPGPVGRSALALFHRYVPKNFGVDLESPSAGRPRASLRSVLTVANLRAFARLLLVTRLDRSGARIRNMALGMSVAYAVIAVKLLVLGGSYSSETPENPTTFREVSVVLRSAPSASQ